MEYRYTDYDESSAEMEARYDLKNKRIPFSGCQFESTEDAVVALIDQFYKTDSFNKKVIHNAMEYLAYYFCCNDLESYSYCDLRINPFEI